MLIEFTVTNFKSIKEPQTLSMLATSIKEHPNNVFDSPDPSIKLLKTAVIYGANASGKSNVMIAFKVFQELVSTIGFSPSAEFKSFAPFLLDSKMKGQPTTFEIEFFGSDGFRYNYKIAYSSTCVEYESLFYYPKGQKAKLFERENGKEIDFGDSLKGLKKSIANLVLPNQVFLNKAANNNNEHLMEVFIALRWVLQTPWAEYQYLLNETSARILFDESGLLKNRLTELLSSFDMGVTGFEVRQKPGQENSWQFSDHGTLVPNGDGYEIKTHHKLFEGDKELEGTEFLFEMESYGTRRFYGLGGYVISLMNKGVALIIDELNEGFHPLMTEAIIKLFHNPETNPNNAQLIFTTHDTSILKSDLFRRDQVWFTEKDHYGATTLFSLAEFDSEVRKNIPFDKWYLSGRFGAIPMISELKNAEPDAEQEKQH